MIRLNTHTVEEIENGTDVKQECFEGVRKLIESVKNKYSKPKEVVFVILLSNSKWEEQEDSSSYFVSSCIFDVMDYIKKTVSVYCLDTVTIFEEYTFKEAFEYCIDHCEIHKLGLENKHHSK
jgi:hypothetical protein